MSEHVHDCTGPDLRCSCGYVFYVPPICVGFDVTRKGELLVSGGFNCESLETAAAALERAAMTLRRMQT